MTVWLAALMLAALAPAAALAAPTAAFVMDGRSGEVLHARNADTRLHPASLTKMMTLYIAFEAIRNGEITLDTPVRISANAAGTPCSCLGARAGQTVAMRHLIRAAALRSANDATTAIGEAISGSEAAFVARMNRTARAMGMNNTTFRNAHGLTAPGHLSTARDMTILGRQLYFDFPQYWNLFSRRSADAGLREVTTTNRAFLDSYRGADGLKTGFTRAAGFNLTASAERDGKRIFATYFGGVSVPDRTRRVTELMDLGFRQAPARAAVRRPPPPNYGATPPAATPPAGAAMAEAGERPAAGRTIRLVTAVSRSPIPPVRPRPGSAPPAAALAAVQQDIEAVLAEVPFAVAEAAPPAPDLGPEAVAALAAEAAEAVTEALGAPVAAAVPAPPPRPDDLEAELPFDVAEAAPEAAAPALPFAVADPAAEAPAEALDMAEAPAEAALAVAEAPRPAEAEAAETSLAETLAATLPPARPDGLAPEAPAQLAEAAPEAPGQVAAAALLPAPDLGSPDVAAPEAVAASTDAPEAYTTAAVARAPAPVAPSVAPVAEKDPLLVLTYTPPAGSRGATVELAALASAPWAEPATAPEADTGLALIGEVVERHLSTSEPRMWAVSLGRFPTRDAAERVLIRTALAERSSFEAALRRVQSRSGGFEATFVGLTQSQALRACDRLRAQDRECATLAP